MADESPQRPFDEAKQILQEQVLRNYPNPERRGCPGNSVLRRLASSGLPAEDDHDWQHVTHCSPCYAEFLSFRAEVKTAHQRAHSQRRLVFATAAAVLIVLCSLWLFTRGAGGGSRPKGGAGNTAPPLVAKASRRSAYLDLQPITTNRGAPGTAEDGLKLNLPVGDLDLKIRLPIGSEDGTYQVQILRQPGQAPFATGSGIASLENHNEFLRIDIDLGGLTPGRYYIAVRRADADWTALPLDLAR